MNSTVTLLRYARLPEGWRRGAVQIGSNGKIKHPYMNSKRGFVSAPNGRYQMRLYHGKLPVYIDLGDEPTDAMARFKAQQAKLSATMAAVKAGLQIADETRKTVKQHAKEFIANHRELPHRSDDSLRVYTQVTGTFMEQCKATYIDQITHEDVRRWHSWMRTKLSYSDRTAANYYIALLAFFRYAGREPKQWIPPATHKMLRSFVSRTPDSYKPEIIEKIIIASRDHGMLWDFAYKTGLRESELKMVTRPDLHLDVAEPYVSVKERDDLGRIKTGEERNVRLHASLVPQLKAWLKDNPDRWLVFGTDGDKQDRKMLRSLKRDAARAGLNCNRCAGCKGRNKECREFTLHKFRRTFCSRMLVAAQGDTRLVMSQSGHKDMQSLMRYLAPTSQLTATLAQAF